jgi:hypothetical protein
MQDTHFAALSQQVHTTITVIFSGARTVACQSVTSAG